MAWFKDWLEQQEQDNPRRVNATPAYMKAPVQDISEPIASLLDSLRKVEDWEFYQIPSGYQADPYNELVQMNLRHTTHPSLTLRVSYWRGVECKKPPLYSLSNMEDGFTPYERGVVTEAINKLIHTKQDVEKAEIYEKARSRFNVLLTETNN
ncbi:MAG: hypothetical protein ACXW1D_00795 [Halobacteriota archaeon]